MMDKDVYTLYKFSMSQLLNKTVHKCFFTQKEFEDNMGIIFNITSSKNNILKKLNEIQ